jgi:hypothetical protein
MLAESSDFQSEMKASYLNNTFPCMEAPTFSRGASLCMKYYTVLLILADTAFSLILSPDKIGASEVNSFFERI